MPGHADFPRVLFVDLSKRFGGASVRALGLMRSFPRERVALAALSNSPVAKAARALGFEVIAVSTSKLNPVIPFQLSAAIRKGKFEILDVQNIQSKFWSSLATAFSRVPIVSTLNSWYVSEHGNNWKGRIYTLVELLTNSKQVRYIAVSKPIYHALLEAGVPAERVDLIFNAVQIDPEEVDSIRDELLFRYRIPQNAIVCVAVGRMVWAKGHEDLVQAFAIAAEQEPRLYGFIVGDGVLRESIERRIRDTGMGERLFLLGNLEHKETLAVVKAGDIYVMPSRSEGTPISLLEAAALGKPILASRVGGIPELMEDGREALLIPAQDVTALAKGLLVLARDKEVARRLAEQAKVRVERDFTLERQAILTKTVYNRAIDASHYRSKD